MTRKLFVLLACVAVFLTACSTSNAPGKPEEEPAVAPTEGGKVAVVYFSATGNTKAVAEKIASSLGVEPQALTPKLAYTEADFGQGEATRTAAEQKDKTARPELSEVPNVADAEKIYLGYPIWNGEAPRVVNTFIEAAGLDGKTVVPFCTSGSQDIAPSEEELKSTYPNITWEKGARFEKDVDDASIEAFLGK